MITMIKDEHKSSFVTSIHIYLVFYHLFEDLLFWSVDVQFKTNDGKKLLAS